MKAFSASLRSAAFTRLLDTAELGTAETADLAGAGGGSDGLEIFDIWILLLKQHGFNSSTLISLMRKLII